MPENHFYTHLDYDTGIGKIVVTKIPGGDSGCVFDSPKNSDDDKLLTADKLKNIVFKKSTKTPSHFEDNVILQDDKFRSGKKDKDDDEELIPKKRIPKMKSSLLKARSGSNATLWNKFVKQNVELAQGKQATTIMYPTADQKEVADEIISYSSTSERLFSK